MLVLIVGVPIIAGKYPILGLSENRFMVFNVYIVLKPRHNEVYFQS